MGLLRKIARKIKKPLQLATGLRQPRIVKRLTLKSTSILPGRLGKKIHRVNQFGVAFGEQSLRDLRRPTLKGVVRMGISFVPVVGQAAAVGLMAYDAKRARQRSRSQTARFRMIRRQALMDAGAVAGRIRILQGQDSVGPLYDSIIPPRMLLNGNGEGTALSGPDLESLPEPGQEDFTSAAPAPEQRGAGGDAAEGSRMALAGAGSGVAALVIIGGLAAALYASRGAK